MPFLLANVVQVIFLAALYAFLFYVAKSMRGHVAGTPAAAPEAVRPAASERPPPAATRVLVVTGADGSQQRHPLPRDLVVGRGTQCDVTLADDFASERHLRVGVDRSGPWVEDLGSTNGTFVDGTRIEGRRGLRQGATIRVGRTTMEVR